VALKLFLRLRHLVWRFRRFLIGIDRKNLTERIALACIQSVISAVVIFSSLPQIAQVFLFSLVNISFVGVQAVMPPVRSIDKRSLYRDFEKQFMDDTLSRMLGR
jgi:Mn2+/Fe2+ NRAMP family transporter